MLNGLPELLTDRTRMVAVSHISNALGTVNPVREIADLAKRVGALVLVDGAQAVPHRRVDVQELGCDFYAFSGHKMCGPTGIGRIVGPPRTPRVDAAVPGGRRDDSHRRPRGKHLGRDPTQVRGRHTEHRGSHHPGGGRGLPRRGRLRRHCRARKRACSPTLSSDSTTLGGVQVYGPTDLHERSGVISFTHGRRPPSRHLDHPRHRRESPSAPAITALNSSCSTYGISATARASFYLYNSTEDVDRLDRGARVRQGDFRSRPEGAKGVSVFGDDLVFEIFASGPYTTCA